MRSLIPIHIWCWSLGSLLLTLTPGQANAQEANPLAAAMAKEQVYLLPDRGSYLGGDTARLALFLWSPLEGTQPLSRVVYVEILAENGQVAWQAKVPMHGGQGSCRLVVSTDWPSGYYLLRAYTKAMRNARPQQFFQHPLPIVQPQAPPPATKQDVSLQLSARTLVPEATQSLTMALTDTHGRTLEAEWQVLGPDSSLLASGNTDSFGLAEITLSSRSGRHTVLIRKAEQVIARQTLATSSQAVALMAALPLPGRPLRITAVSSTRYQGCRLQLVQQGQLWLEQAVTIGPKSRSWELTTSGCKPGIAEIRLLHNKGNVLARRFIFFSPAASSFAPTPDIRTSISEPLPLVSDSLSASTVSGIWLYEGESWVAWPELALGWNTLPQPWRLPMYCLSCLPAKALHQALALQPDSLPLPAPGWLDPEPYGIRLTGTISTSDGRPLPQVWVRLAVPGAVADLHLARSDSAGRFAFTLESILGQPETVIILGPDSIRNYGITLDPGFAPTAPLTSWPTLTLTAAERKQFEARYRWQQLQHRFPRPEADGPEPLALYNGTNSFGRVVSQYRLQDFVAMPTEACIREYVREVFVRRLDGKRILRISDQGTNQFLAEPPLLLLDGVPVRDPEDLLDLPYQRIERFEVVNESYYLNGLAFGGIFQVISKQGDFSSGGLAPGDLWLRLHLYAATAPSLPTGQSSDLQAWAVPVPVLANPLHWHPITGDIPGRGYLHLLYTTQNHGWAWREFHLQVDRP